jgi:hypothetical protein
LRTTVPAEHLVPGREGGARADGVDHPGVLLTDPGRERDVQPRHPAAAHRDVEGLDAGRPHPDADLARPRRGIGPLGDAQHLGRTETVEHGGSHARQRAS